MADFERNITGAKAVIDVMKILGLAAPVSVADSTDQTAQQLWTLATQAGQLLLDEHDWQVLSREMTIVTVPNTPNYALPDDWNNFQADASWNRTTQRQAIGSLRQHEWQMLKASTVAGTTFALLYRIQGGEVVFSEAPTEVMEVVLPYTSRSWVQAADTSYKDNLLNNDDVVLYDSQLFKAKLKLSWRNEKGFDTTREQAELDDILVRAKGKDTPIRTISIVPGFSFPYLGFRNIPETGYGS